MGRGIVPPVATGGTPPDARVLHVAGQHRRLFRAARRFERRSILSTRRGAAAGYPRPGAGTRQRIPATAGQRPLETGSASAFAWDNWTLPRIDTTHERHRLR